MAQYWPCTWCVLGDEFVLCPVESQIAEVLNDHTNMNKVRIKAVHALQSETELIQSPREGSHITTGCSAMLMTHSRPKAQIELFEGADAIGKKLLTETYGCKQSIMDRLLSLSRQCESKSNKPKYTPFATAAGNFLIIFHLYPVLIHMQ